MMRERSDRISCAVSTANGFAMSMRISQPTPRTDLNIDEKSFQKEFVRRWVESVRVLGTSLSPTFGGGRCRAIGRPSP